MNGASLAPIDLPLLYCSHWWGEAKQGLVRGGGCLRGKDKSVGCCLIGYAFYYGPLLSEP